MDFLSNGEARTIKFPKEHETVSSASRPMFLYSLPRNNIFYNIILWNEIYRGSKYSIKQAWAANIRIF